jgi:YD repeat-containing protein
MAITYGYDAASQRASMAQPTGLFTYTHDPAGRVATLANPAGQVTSWQYDAASRVTATVMANGTLRSNTYDSADQVLLLANITTKGNRRHPLFAAGNQFRAVSRPARRRIAASAARHTRGSLSMDGF